MKGRLRIIFITLTVLFLIILYLVGLASLPYNPLSLSSSHRFDLISIIPEGWAFFTRNAREDVVYVYKKDENNKWNLISIPGGSSRYLFGLNRKGRAFDAEVGLLLQEVPETKWIESKRSIDYFFEATTVLPVIKVENEVNFPSCTGEVIIQKTPLIPWAWSTLKTKIIMPYKIVELNVTSSKKIN